jgi:hypothetical protein
VFEAVAWDEPSSRLPRVGRPLSFAMEGTLALLGVQRNAAQKEAEHTGPNARKLAFRAQEQERGNRSRHQEERWTFDLRND